MSSPRPEFSRIINLEDIVLGETFSISASPEELHRLETRFDIQQIKSLNASYTIENYDQTVGSYKLNIQIKSSGSATQEESSKFSVDDSSEIILLPRSMSEEDLEPYEEYDIEFINNGTVDVGELVSQYLSLNIYM